MAQTTPGASSEEVKTEEKMTSFKGDSNTLSSEQPQKIKASKKRRKRKKKTDWQSEDTVQIEEMQPNVAATN